jgi:hypothetical protein
MAPGAPRRIGRSERLTASTDGARRSTDAGRMRASGTVSGRSSGATEASGRKGRRGPRHHQDGKDKRGDAAHVGRSVLLDVADNLAENRVPRHMPLPEWAGHCRNPPGPRRQPPPRGLLSQLHALLRGFARLASWWRAGTGATGRVSASPCSRTRPVPASGPRSPEPPRPGAPRPCRRSR